MEKLGGRFTIRPPGDDIHVAAKAGDINAVRRIQRAKPHSVHSVDETGAGMGRCSQGWLGISGC